MASKRARILLNMGRNVVEKKRMAIDAIQEGGDGGPENAGPAVIQEGVSTAGVGGRAASEKAVSAAVSKRVVAAGVPGRVSACGPKGSIRGAAPELGYQAKVAAWLKESRTQNCKKRLFSPEKKTASHEIKVSPTASEGQHNFPIQETSRKHFSETLPRVEQENYEQKNYGPSPILNGCDNRGDLNDLDVDWATPSQAEGPCLIYQEPLEDTDSARVEGLDDEHGDLTARPEEVVEEPREVLNQDGNGDAATPRNDEERTPTANHPKTRTRTPASTDSSVRKRSRNPALWKANVRKTAKNTGQEYISARGKLVSPKKMRPPCSCSMDCVHRITEEQRQGAFKRFWELGNHEQQWEYIRSHSTKHKTKPGKEEKECKRTSFRRYFFYDANGDQVKVCKQMFMATLSIWDTWIDSAYAHLNSAEGNTSTPDKRGRHGNHNWKIQIVLTPPLL